MDHASQMDGSDAQDRDASSYSERYAALKRHLHDVVLILESFDQIFRDNLKQDGEYNDLVQRFLSNFSELPLPDLSNRINQVIKSGLLDISMSIAQLAGRKVNEPTKNTVGAKSFVEPDPSSSPSTSSTRFPKSISSARPMGDAPGLQQSTSAATPLKKATCHFLKGSCTLKTAEVLDMVNGDLAVFDTGGRVETAQYIYQSANNPLWPTGIVLTCSNTSDMFFRALEAADFSSLWSNNAVVHVRRQGKVTYGLRIPSPAHIYNTGLQTIATIQSNLVAEINLAYLQQTSTRGQDRQSSVAVTEDLGGGVYLFSGPVAQDLENVVAAGKQTVAFVLPQFPYGERSFTVVIEPFRLCDLE